MLPVLQHCALWSHMYQSCFHPIEIEVDAPSSHAGPCSNGSHLHTARMDGAAGDDEDDALSVDVGGACPHRLSLHVAGWATVHIRVGAESVPAGAESASQANDATVRIERVANGSTSGLATGAASGRNRGSACSDAFATRALRRAQFSLPLLLHYLLRADA